MKTGIYSQVLVSLVLKLGVEITYICKEFKHSSIKVKADYLSTRLRFTGVTALVVLDQDTFILA